MILLIIFLTIFILANIFLRKILKKDNFYYNNIIFDVLLIYEDNNYSYFITNINNNTKKKILDEIEYMILSEKSPIHKITISNKSHYKVGYDLISVDIDHLNKKKSGIILLNFIDFNKILRYKKNYIKIKKL